MHHYEYFLLVQLHTIHTIHVSILCSKSSDSGMPPMYMNHLNGVKIMKWHINNSYNTANDLLRLGRDDAWTSRKILSCSI